MEQYAAHFADELARLRSEERGWLIELKGTTPTWCFSLYGDDTWTADAARALRFARKQDAESVINEIGWTEAFASEHVWSGDGLRQCDCCGRMKADVKSVHVSYAGDTNACEDCRNVNN